MCIKISKDKFIYKETIKTVYVGYPNNIRYPEMILVYNKHYINIIYIVQLTIKNL